MTNKKAEQAIVKELNLAEQMLQQNTIACEFCGQLLIGKECNCQEAIEEREKHQKIRQALDITLPLLTSSESCEQLDFLPINDESILELLNISIDNVGKEKIIKIQIKIDDETTFTIQNKQSFIEISRKENASKVVKLGG